MLGQEKSNKHQHFGRDGVRDNPSLGQIGPLPGTNWDPSLGQIGTRPWEKPANCLLNSTVKSPFCPLCPWDDCPARAVSKFLMCFLFIEVSPIYRIPGAEPVIDVFVIAVVPKH